MLQYGVLCELLLQHRGAKNKRLSLQRTAPYCPPTPRSSFLVDGDDRGGHVVVGEDFADHVVGREGFADHGVGDEEFADYRDQEEKIANAEHHLSSPSTKSTLCIPHPSIPG